MALIQALSPERGSHLLLREGSSLPGLVRHRLNDATTEELTRICGVQAIERWELWVQVTAARIRHAVAAESGTMETDIRYTLRNGPEEAVKRVRFRT